MQGLLGDAMSFEAKLVHFGFVIINCQLQVRLFFTTVHNHCLMHQVLFQFLYFTLFSCFYQCFSGRVVRNLLFVPFDGEFSIIFTIKLLILFLFIL